MTQGGTRHPRRAGPAFDTLVGADQYLVCINKLNSERKFYQRFSQYVPREAASGPWPGARREAASLPA